MFAFLLVSIPLLLGGAVQAPEFPNRVHVLSGRYQPLVQVDLDGDGAEELVGLLLQGDEVHVYPPIAGGWASRAVFPMPAETRALSVRDMTGDGRMDLVVLHGLQDAQRFVSVFAGLPTGGFAQPVATFVGKQGGFQVGDVDGDGALDLVFVLGKPNLPKTLTVLLGDGSGAFGAPHELASTQDLRVGQPARLDATPALEIVTVKSSDQLDSQDVEVLRFSPTTGFTSIDTRTIPASQREVQVVDLNADGFDDLVAVGKYFGADTIWSSLGQGDGTFAPETEVPTSMDGGLLEDLDGDGFVDLASNVEFARGDGTTSFAPSLSVQVTGSFGGGGFLSRDMNEDGIVDLLQLAFPAGQSTWLAELRGLPDGTYEYDRGLLGVDPARAVSALPDMNGDGLDDVALIRSDASAATVRAAFSESDGQGGFGSRYGVVHPLGCAVGASPKFGDFDGDGRGDVLFASSCDTTLYLQKQSRQFDPGIALSPFVPFSSQVADFDGDGRDDVLTDSQVLFGEVDGLSAGPTLIVDLQNALIGDVDGDGRPDVVSAVGATTIETWFAQADRTFLGPVATDLPSTYYSLRAVADLDEDGPGDLVVLRSPSDLWILRGQGDGSFATMQTPALPRQVLFPLSAGDLNADGHVDLFGGKDVLVVLTGRGDGTFLEPDLFGYRGLGSFGVTPRLARHRSDQATIHYDDAFGFSGFVKQSALDQP